MIARCSKELQVVRLLLQLSLDYWMPQDALLCPLKIEVDVQCLGHESIPCLVTTASRPRCCLSAFGPLSATRIQHCGDSVVVDVQ